MVAKLRTFLLPLVLLALGFMAGYALLAWLFVFRTGWLPLDEHVITIWLPALLAMVAAGLVMEPYVRRFRFSARSNVSGLYVFLAMATVAGPAILALNYLQATHGRLAAVPDAAAALRETDARFFTLAKPCLNKPAAVAHPRFAISGDRNESLDVTLYVAVPFCGAQRLWLGLTYEESINNNLDDKRKDALYDAFVTRIDLQVRNLDARGYRYYERVGQNADRRAFLKALKDGKVEVASPIFLTPHEEPLGERGGFFLGGAALALATGLMLWVVLVLVTPLKTPEEIAAAPKDDASVGALFIPTREAFGLQLLLDINLLVFLAMVVSGIGVLDFEVDDLIPWGASYGPLNHGLGLYRLVSATFVHAGLFHLLGNLYALLIGGAFLAPVARNMRLLLCYLVCGIGGSLLSVAVHPDIVSVGASGAIFGLFGVLLTLIVFRDPKMVPLTRAVLYSVGVFVVFNAIYGAITPGIDNFAHIGGFLAGIPCGIAIALLDRCEARKAGNSTAQAIPDSSPHADH